MAPPPPPSLRTLDGQVLTRGWRDTPDGLLLTYWLATVEGPLRVRITRERAVMFVEHLEMEFEVCYRRFFMPTLRGSDEGSAKRYAGLVDGKAGRQRPAARLLDRPAREVRYLITTRGPEPVEQLRSPIDHRHYLERPRPRR